ncbi:WXG100 family type VII secretion target [Leucobacter musarum]|uniref:WXG100 family type VII secretion target n=1 Tax=Leucobacter musarum TaxID=1930747 RepID=UPI000AE4F3C7|nr:hypothetical protein [Leucobacter musarum]
MNAQAAQSVSTVQRCSADVDRLASAINGAISMIPAPLRSFLNDILQKWDEFCAEVQRLFELFEEVISYGLGDPAALRTAAESWKTSVTNLLESAADLVRRDDLPATDSWEGPASDAYRVIVTMQHDAIENVEDSAKLIGEALGKHADSIESFWGNILNGLVNFALALAGAVVSAIALVPPVTPIGVIGLILSIVGAVKSLWDLFATEISDLEQFSEDARALGESVAEKFEDPWPSLVAS